ncbi:bifunctional adenosylcobinamide kinase/adenosylcobinamide-phosphate guanylyltransferase [Pseudonocardia phyllosphaerae]|uniref:bifunctional adenosylcobinamide kinase/adenosylcobinamide-phosphate guanylyltransferase n=1 Tax=Pseudonocardia phyllosphaerae TaxID=3390502 RepID=UPI00397C7884
MTNRLPLRTLVLGGTRSGKSRYAEELFDDGAPVRYLATGRRIPGDAEWDARIAAHAARRPAGWSTEEITTGPGLAAALAVPGPVLVDDLATWLTGVLDDAGAWDAPAVPAEVDETVSALVTAVRDAPGPLVLVSAEVGLGVVPESRAGRLFRDRLGELNAALADVCDDSVLLVAGRALSLGGAVRVAASEGPGSGAAVSGEAVSAGAGAAVSGAAASGAPVSGDHVPGGAVSGAAVSGAAADDPAEPGTPAGDVAGTPAQVPGAVDPAGPVAPDVPAGDAAPDGADPATSPPAVPDPAVPDPAVPDPVVPATVERPDRTARREATARVAALATPAGGLGRLGELGIWLASCQGHCPPRPPGRARVVLLAADHGVAEAGVSAYGPEVSAARAVAAAAERLPVTVAAAASGAGVRVVDVGLATAGHGLGDEHVVARGSGRIDHEGGALTAVQARRAWDTGRALADSEIDDGADLLLPATLAVGVSTPASTLVAAVTGTEPVAVVGRGSGIDDRAWMRKTVAVRDALRRARPHTRDPLALLASAGGTDLTVLAGLLARAAERKVPCVLDGLAVGAAALLAEELAPGARDWWLAAQPSTEPAAGIALEQLSLTPVLDLAVRAEDGTAAVAVLPLLVTAARVLADTATAGETGIVPAGDRTTAAAGR